MENTPNTSTALSTLTPEQQKRLDRDRSRTNNSYPTIPQIRLANTDMQEAPEGEYFIETKNGDEKEIRKIGKNPEITILYKTVTYSWFDQTVGEKGELVAWTSDIHGYGDNPVTMYLKVNGKVTIDFEGTFNEFKKYRTKFDIINNVTGLKKGSDLTFKNVLYVLFEGKPHKMFVTNTGAVGVQPDGKPSFDKCQTHSMQDFTDMCYHDAKALYDFAVTMGSKLVRQKNKLADGKTIDPDDNDPSVLYAAAPKPYYIMQFESIRPLEDADVVKALDASMNAEKAIYMIDEMRKNSVREEQSKVTAEEAAAVFGDDPSASL